MEREKIYYAAVILVSAVSILLSPFFYVSRGKQNAKPAGSRSWMKIIAGNILMAAVLLAVWWFWLRRNY
ncbi:hypothetical protein [Neisseria sp. 74A18]|uniref:hypothetical protein n=1 Tax=Neisseria sp. 74A18 TaxID=1696094 RepID=UPI0006CAC077|nr:hypothetical protein [Neisseria sp. 74A18]KPN74949.1 hypothetical protein AKG43_00020 [Neisseria sp. 74A18]